MTFTNAPPFNVLGVPECGDAVRPQLVLYLPKNNARCGGAKSNDRSKLGVNLAINVADLSTIYSAYQLIVDINVH